MAAHTHTLGVSCCFLRRKAQQFFMAVHPLRIPCPLPHCPSAPPDTPKLMIEVHPREIVTKGESVTMTCHINSSNPEPTSISWLKDRTPLREPGMLQRAQKTLTLTLSDVTKEMSGQYYCEARNDIGSETSRKVVLQVRCEPPGSWGGAGRELA